MNRKRRSRATVAVALLVGGSIGPSTAPATAQGPVVVTNGEELRDAFEDPQVTAIQLGADISLCAFEDRLERDSANDLSIDGAGFTVSKTCPGGIFVSLGEGALALENLTLADGESSINGGAVLALGDVTATNSTFEDNTSDGIFGGAIDAQGSLTVADSHFRDNSVLDGGGAISAGGVITVTGSTFAGNSAFRGGAIFGSSDGVHVTGSVLEDNSAFRGGAIGIDGEEGSVTVTGTVFEANSADGDGGAIRAPTVVVTGDSTLQGNSAEGVGGAIFASTAEGDVTVNDSTLAANHSIDGGAIFAESGVSVGHSILRENTTSGFGGAINALGEVVITHSTLDGNTADASGGAIAADGPITVVASTLSGNGALGADGGAIAAFGSGATLTNVTVSGNHADGGGGAVFTDGDLELLHATIVGNAADAGANLSLHTDATLVSFGSVVALPANGAENCSLTEGATTTSNGYNLTDDASCGFTEGTDIVGADPELTGLTDNGGPTETRTPRSGSPLIEAIPTGDCHPDVPTDQRDVQRPRLGGCDIGAVEVEVPVAVDNLYQDVPRFEMYVAPDSVLDNDAGPPGMTIEVRTGPVHGALAVDPDGGFAYTLADPDDPATSDSFTYVAILADASGESYPSNEATVILELVDAPSGAPPLPVRLGVDLQPLASDGNGVLEPGESVEVAPSWRNRDVETLFLTGIASDLAGPEGPTYTLVADHADYGEVGPGELGDCRETGLCYRVEVGPEGVDRPAKHWDAGFDETLAFVALAGDGTSQPWALHIGDSFVDVPRSNPFYRFIETLLHHHVCSGCSATEYCPEAGTTRAQMAVFLLRAREGRDYQPPACDPQAQVFGDVPSDNPFCPWIEELSRRGATSGCGGGDYCPGQSVTRTQMAAFLLRTLQGPGYTPPACTPGSPPFTDVPSGSSFCPWIAELAARSITAGCGDGAYCPDDPVSRAQMAVFLSRTFGLTLYGP